MSREAGCLLVGLLFAFAAVMGPGVARSEEPHEVSERRWRKPSGWVGEFPPEKYRDGEDVEAPGGGDLSPTEAGGEDLPVPAAELDVAQVEAPALVNPHDDAVVAALDDNAGTLPAPAVLPLGVNSEGMDIPRAEAPRSAMHDFSSLAGEFTWSNDDVKEPQYVYVQYGFSTTIELLNGERPSGGAFCGLCGPDGAFEVTALSNRVGIKPREMSAPEDPKWGVLATNLTVFTDTGRTLTFIVVEVTGLGLRRTDRHEVRSARGDAALVVGWTLQGQVDQTAREIEARYDEKLREETGRLLETKAEQAFESYGDFDVEEKSKRGRKVTLESVATIGDRTIIKFHVPADVALGTPVAMVKYGDEIRVLPSLNVSKDVKTVDGESWAFFVLSVEAAQLTGKQRIAVSVSDLDHGREMRSSAGRV